MFVSLPVTHLNLCLRNTNQNNTSEFFWNRCCCFSFQWCFFFHFRKLLETKNRTWFLQHHLSTCPLLLHLFWFHAYNLCHIPLAYLQHHKLMFEVVVTYYHNPYGNTYTVISRGLRPEGNSLLSRG